MYIQDKKKETNIDSEFEGNNFFKKFKPNFKKILVMVIIVFLIVPIIILYITSNKDKKPTENVTTEITLNGEREISVYKDTSYLEPGYNAIDSKGRDLTWKVNVSTDLDLNVIGKYEIFYTINEAKETRIINVVEKPEDYMYIALKKVNGDANLTIKVGSDYVEPGYIVTTPSQKIIDDKEVIIDNRVDTTKPGEYIVVYTMKDNNNVTITRKRTVIVTE